MLSNIMLKVAFHEFYAEYHYAECRYAECHDAHQRPNYIGKVVIESKLTIALLIFPLGGHVAFLTVY